MTVRSAQGYTQAYMEAGIDRAINAGTFLEEFGPLLREMLEVENRLFQDDPGRPDPPDERLGGRRSEAVSSALELLADWLDNDPRAALEKP